jgi:hypothetical protein
MSDFLEEKRQEILARMDELRPLVDEFHRLEAAEAALSGVGARSRPSGPGPGSGSARPARGAEGNGAARAGRPRGTGTRAGQALELVRERPGITIPELAEAMDIQQNYLYRVMPSLAEEGKVVKSGRGWHLRDGAQD